MNPLSLHLRRCGTWHQLDLDLPAGALALVGPNGAGKSTLVNAIEVALFGPEGRTLATLYPRGSDSDEPLLIELVFEHAGEHYRVRRSYSPKGRGQSKTDLDIAAPDYGEAELRAGITLARERGEMTLYYDRWEPLTEESQTRTQEILEEIIGLSRDTFRSSAFLAQDEAGRFCEAPPSQQKAMLADAVGLHEWDTYLERARVERRSAESERDHRAGALDRAEQELAERPRLHDQLTAIREIHGRHEQRLATTSAQVATARDTLAEARTRHESRASVEAAHKAAQSLYQTATAQANTLAREIGMLEERLAGRAALQERADDLQRWQDALEEYRRTSERWQRREALLSEHTRLMAESARLLVLSEALHARATEVLAPSTQELCDRCGQALHADAAERAAASYRAEAAEHELRRNRIQEAELPDLNKQIGELPAEAPSNARLALLRQKLEAAQAAREQLAALDEAQERYTVCERELAQVRAELPARQGDAQAAAAAVEQLGPHDPSELPRATDALRVAELAETQMRQAVQESDRDIARREEALARLNELAASTTEMRELQEGTLSRIDLYAALERACGRNGVPALILESVVIPQIEVEASRILALLGGPAFAVELRTRREKKTGGLADTLQITLLTDTGEALYESFSGGERARVAFALRLALTQLLAARRGAQTGLLVIDELAGLDAEGIGALVGVLEGLSAKIRTILCVSHQAELRDAFANTLAVENVAGRSRVVGDRAVSGVLA